MAEQNKYQSTLNLPVTEFPMRAGLPRMEPKRLDQWSSENLYGRIMASRENAPPFILHDGPPYANGPIHTGTAMNKILKDMVVKYKTMRGFRAPYVPGWDCHGLPIEKKVCEELKTTKHQADQVTFRKQARAYAAKFIDVQRNQFKRLGVLGEWDNPYITMDYQYEADIVRAFGELYAKGYVYKGLKPIHWCPTCETALAEAEVEHADHTSPSIYVKFPVADEQKLPLGPCPNPSILIWTTTPWTLPADRAVTVKHDANYSAVPLDGETLIIANDLVAQVFSVLDRPAPKATASCTGAALEGILLVHPTEPGRTVPVILGDHVTMDTGTGCVHTAPGHGEDDYHVGLKYSLEVASPVDDRGCFTDAAPLWKGKHVFKANEHIVAFLKEKGILLQCSSVSHSYPHCWRCHKPVIFRATEQWFVNVSANSMRDRAIEEIAKVEWIPAAGRQRISAMMETRPDWCLSRQRLWGVPVPAFYCQACGAAVTSKAICDHVAAIIERDGSDAWFVHEPAELMPKGTTCPSCGGTEFRRETDILDVWFDSGLSHRAVLDRRPNLSSPADLYLEGSDQHRGWFQVSLLTGVGLNNQAPYRAVLTHGWTLTESGEKESKSKGNFTDPMWVCNEFGADILRLWVGSVNYMQDVTISPNLLGQIGDAYRRIRNTFKFLLGNLHGFDPRRDAVPADRLTPLDRYMLMRLEHVRQECLQAYDRYEFYRVFHVLYHFCAVDLSARYCDILKDRLYTEQADSSLRRSAQTVLRRIVVVLARLAAPILAFTADEVWEFVKTTGSKEEGTDAASVHESLMPDEPEAPADACLLDEYNRLWAVRDEVLRSLETKRQAGGIGSSQEAAVWLHASSDGLKSLLESRAAELPSFFIVSQVHVAADADESFGPAVDIPGLRIKVTSADGSKCARCWNYSPTVGHEAAGDDLCRRCAAVINHVRTNNPAVPVP